MLCKKIPESRTLAVVAEPDVELTILMPCLNEARTLPTCIGKASGFLARAGIAGEVLVADNGSTDGSQELARRHCARVIAVSEKGYGSALLAGIRAARGRYVIMGDSDDSYDFSQLDLFVDRLREGEQLVMGNRFAGGIQAGAMPPLHRYLGNPVLTAIGRILFQSPCKDFHCGLRGFDRDAILKLDLCATGMEFASEMVVKASVWKLRIAEVPTTLAPDGRDRAPHLRSWRDGWRHLRLLLLFSPRGLFLYPGALLFGLGTLVMLRLVIGPIVFGSVGFDINTLLYASAATVIWLAVDNVLGLRERSTARKRVSCRRTRVRGRLGAKSRLSHAAGQLVGIRARGCAGILFACGLGLGRVRRGEPEQTMRLVIPATTLMLLSVQSASAACFAEVLSIRRRSDASYAP